MTLFYTPAPQNREIISLALSFHENVAATLVPSNSKQNLCMLGKEDPGAPALQPYHRWTWQSRSKLNHRTAGVLMQNALSLSVIHLPKLLCHCDRNHKKVRACQRHVQKTIVHLTGSPIASAGVTNVWLRERFQRNCLVMLDTNSKNWLWLAG